MVSTLVRTEEVKERLCQSGGAATASGSLALSCTRGAPAVIKLDGALRFRAVSAMCVTGFGSRAATFGVTWGTVTVGGTFVRTDEAEETLRASAGGTGEF